jgi:hypothetical protein
MTASDEIQTQGGVSRRTVLKGAVVAGGLAWTAPTVMAGPAWATHDTQTQCFFIKISSNSGVSSPNYPSSCIAEHPNAPQDLGANDVLDGDCLIEAGLIIIGYTPATGFVDVEVRGVAAEGLDFIGGKLAKNTNNDVCDVGECCRSAQGPAFPTNPLPDTFLSVVHSVDGTTPVTNISFDAESNVSYIELFICITFGSIPPECV